MQDWLSAENVIALTTALVGVVASAVMVWYERRVPRRWGRIGYRRGGDHIPFLERAYPAARFTEPTENYAHQHQDVRVENGKQYGDLPEFCDFPFIARVAKVNAAAVWSLAQAPGTPRGAKILTAALTNSTELTWTRGPEPDLAGYEVVWRETTEPDWTHVIPVGDVTKHKVDLSKDNVFFGVRGGAPSGVQGRSPEGVWGRSPQRGPGAEPLGMGRVRAAGGETVTEPPAAAAEACSAVPPGPKAAVPAPSGPGAKPRPRRTAGPAERTRCGTPPSSPPSPPAPAP